MLGGCSSINGMIYMRGQSEDFDRWAAITGDNEWSWKKSLERYKSFEDYHSGSCEYHGVGGESPSHLAATRINTNAITYKK